MQQKSLTLINKLGLHARAAMKFIELASRFSCDVKIAANDREIDGKDILHIMAMGLPVGTEITIKTDGPDDKQALKALVDLVNDRFGEGE